MDGKDVLKSTAIIGAFIGFYLSLLLGGPMLISVTAMIVKWLAGGV